MYKHIHKEAITLILLFSHSIYFPKRTSMCSAQNFSLALHAENCWISSIQNSVTIFSAFFKLKLWSPQLILPFLFVFLPQVNESFIQFSMSENWGPTWTPPSPFTNQSLKTTDYPSWIVSKFFLQATLAAKVQIRIMPHLECYSSHPFNLIIPSSPSFPWRKNTCLKTEPWSCISLRRVG